MRSRCAPRCASAGSGETRDSPRRRPAGGAFHPATARSPRFVGACIVVFRRAFRLGKLRGPSHNPPFSDTRTRHAREIGALSRGVDGQVVAAMKPRRFSRMPKPSSTCSAASRDERAYRALHASTTTTAAEESAIRRSRNGDRVTGISSPKHRCAQPFAHLTHGRSCWSIRLLHLRIGVVAIRVTLRGTGPAIIWSARPAAGRRDLRGAHTLVRRMTPPGISR